jgi:hypothetical protein
VDERLKMTEQIVFRDGKTGRAAVSESDAPVGESVGAMTVDEPHPYASSAELAG